MRNRAKPAHKCLQPHTDLTHNNRHHNTAHTTRHHHFNTCLIPTWLLFQLSSRKYTGVRPALRLYSIRNWTACIYKRQWWMREIMYDNEVKQCTKESFLPTALLWHFVDFVDSLCVRQLVKGEGWPCLLIKSRNDTELSRMTLYNL